MYGSSALLSARSSDACVRVEDSWVPPAPLEPGICELQLCRPPGGGGLAMMAGAEPHGDQVGQAWC